MSEKNRVRLGVLAVVVGSVTILAGSFFAHFTGLPEVNDVGVEIYPAVPRGWYLVIVGQIVAIIGAHLVIAGIVIGYLWDRPMTWARASVGATLFALEAMILFGLIPNEWLTLTQSTFEWTPQRIAFDIPRVLVLNNEVGISYAAIKDIVSGTYSALALGAVAGAMIFWQERQKKLASGPPPEKISEYGRPMVRAVSRVED